MNPPIIETTSDVLKMAQAVRDTIGKRNIWAYSDILVAPMSPAAFSIMLLRDWNDVWTDEQCASILALYRLT